ncbi:MAG: DUF4905 domain-containing protein [Bacteroidetes bacterium]|nr:DUF4905 domain-containing protein [Bacteroidota bacterium]
MFIHKLKVEKLSILAMVHERWRYTAHGFIWKLQYSPSKRIVGEVRDLEKREVSFFCLDAITGTPLWQDLQKEEKWWIELEHVDQHLVFFSRFEQPNIPRHRGIECCSLENGRTLWKNNDVTFWFDSPEKVCGYKDYFEGRRAYWISKETGGILEEIPTSHSFHFVPDQQSYVRVPFPYDLYEEKNLVDQCLQHHGTDTILSATIEVIPTEQYVVVGYYTQSVNPTLNLHLNVFEKEKQQCLYSVLQENNCRYPVQENFFIAGSMLYYVREQRTLIGVALWRS